jgi:hypothetical protein
MPVIVYKTLDLNIHYVQARRILCEHCRLPYTYVFGESKKFQATGVPLVSSDEGMRASAMKSAAKSLSKIAQQDKKGSGMCPNCRRFQKWMVRHSQAVGLGCGFLGGLGVSWFGGFMVLAWMGWSENLLPGIMVGGTALGLGLGKVLSLSSGQHNEADPASMKDDQVPGFLAKCEKEQVDPILYWYLALGNEAKDNEALVSLGIRDRTGRVPIFPRELSSEYAIRELQS